MRYGQVQVDVPDRKTSCAPQNVKVAFKSSAGIYQFKVGPAVTITIFGWVFQVA